MLSLAFLRAHGRLLLVGALLCFCSSAGQTYFISLFGGEIRAAFDLTHGGFGSVYAIGTLASAATLIWCGRVVDKVPLPLVAAAVLLLLGANCAIMATAGGLVALTLAIFGLRLFGQGLSVHTAMTAMARYFDAERGRAVSIASLGNAAGAALAPILVILALSAYDWRTVWLIAGAGLLGAAALVLFLLRGHAARDLALAARAKSGGGSGARDWTLSEVLRDPALWLRLPALLAPAFISTGLIFHQVYLAQSKDWPLSLVAGSFSVYAITSVAALMAAGPMVDRFSARRIMPLFLMPLFVSCMVLAVFDARWAAPLFFGFLGMSTGVAAVLKGALWAELYGVSHLGAIRAFGQAAMVFSSGVAPAAMGLMIDHDMSIEAIAIASAAYCIAASVLTVDLGHYRWTRIGARR